MKGFEILPVRPEHVPRLVELCGLHAAYERATVRMNGLEERLEEALFGRHSRIAVWVAQAPPAGNIVGFASATPVFSTWHGESYLHVDCLFLADPARGHGIGRALMHAARAHAAALGLRWLEWQTPAWNAPALRFYDRLGAVRSLKQRYSWPTSPAAEPGGLAV